MIFYKLLLNSGISIPENAIIYTAPSKLDIPKNSSGISKHAFSKGVGVIIPTTSTLPSVFANTSVTSISVPANVTSVPKECFRGCSELHSFAGPYATEDGTMFIIDNKIMGVASKSGTDFTIPESVTSIENYAFEGCSGTLTILCNSVPGGTSETNCPTKNGWLYGAAFSNIIIKSSSIGLYAFYEMTSIKDITLDPKENQIGYKAKLTIEDGAFGMCTGITEVNIPAVLTLDIQGAFYGCSNIKNFTGYCATEDGKYVISKNGTLMAAVSADTHIIPSSVINIGTSVFKKDVISEVVLPEGLCQIWGNAFSQSEITSINIPSTVNYIQPSTFGVVHSVDIANIDQWCRMTAYSKNLIGSDTLVRCNGEPITSVTIPDDVEYLESNAFSNFSELKTVIFPDAIDTIGSSAFYNCKSLESISIPEDHGIRINNSAFMSCSSLSSPIVLTACVLGYYAFAECKSLLEVRFKDSISFDYQVFSNSENMNVFIECNVSQMDTSVFGGSGVELTIDGNVGDAGRSENGLLRNSKFKILKIGKNVKKIGNYFFYQSSLKEIHIPDIDTWLNIELGEYSYLNMSNIQLKINGDYIEEVTIPDTITSIRDSAFKNASTIKTLVISDSVASIGKEAFYECTNMENVYFGNNVTSVSDYAFGVCNSIKKLYIPNLTDWCSIAFTSVSSNPMYFGPSIYVDGEIVESIEIPSSVTEINGYAFNGAKLKTVLIHDDVTTIGKYAFYMSTFDSLKIPSSVTTIGSNAFQGCRGEALIECSIQDASSSSYAPFYYSNFSKVVVGGSSTRIGNYSFYYSQSLEELEVGDSVTYIGTRAFYNNYRLHTVTLGKSVALISGKAFAKTAVKTVYCKATTPPEVLDASLFMYGGENLKIYVPVEALDTYKTDKAWSNYKDYIFGYNFE